MVEHSGSAGCSAGYAEIKRKIRKLKKLEVRIRFGSMDPDQRPAAAELEWDAFFNLSEVDAAKARYSIDQLAAMSREDYRKIIGEFFYAVYDRFYRENGIVPISLYDADILAQLDLPPDADDCAIKKRFRELALKYHPDAGGNAARFIELVGHYRKLIEKGK